MGVGVLRKPLAWICQFARATRFPRAVLPLRSALGTVPPTSTVDSQDHRWRRELISCMRSRSSSAISLGTFLLANPQATNRSAS